MKQCNHLLNIRGLGLFVLCTPCYLTQLLASQKVMFDRSWKLNLLSAHSEFFIYYGKAYVAEQNMRLWKKVKVGSSAVRAPSVAAAANMPFYAKIAVISTG